MSELLALPLMLLWVLLGLLTYVLPILVASRRRVAALPGIAALTLLLGWTVIGWAAALVWAIAAQPGPRLTPPPPGRSV